MEGKPLEDMRSGGMMQGAEQGLPTEDTRERGRLTYGICDCKRRPNMGREDRKYPVREVQKTKKKRLVKVKTIFFFVSTASWFYFGIKVLPACSSPSKM